ncbi:MAG: alginate lyase family protein [Bryocella sp.]
MNTNLMYATRFCGVLLIAAIPLHAQKVKDAKASYLDVPARQTFVEHTTSPLVLKAKASLLSCVKLADIPAPQGHFTVPSHYLNGSYGPTNPLEAKAVKPYYAFETRITSGINQYVATGNEAEAACALAQMDEWARGKALLDFDTKESSQAWFQVEWTLSSLGATESVLVNDPHLDPAQQKRVIAWLDVVAHRMLSFEKPGDGNNHRYWRALAATSVGVVANDNGLFRHGIDVFHDAVAQEDANGAFPLEMKRHERAIHYQFFALQPLVILAEFGERQGVPLYAYSSHGRTLRDAVVFLGKAVDDPSIVKQYNPVAQKLDYGGSDYSPFQFYAARFGVEGLGKAMPAGLRHSTTASRIGGNTTVLAAK